MLGLYFHFPFCLSKCIYCDFGSSVISQNSCNNNEFQEKYCECCKKQLLYFSQKINKQPITSIYFGGGTPSLLNPNVVKELIEFAKDLFDLSNDCEITLETNPTSFEIEKFEEFKNAGIKRISIGIQSMDNKNLAWLGRKHNIEQGIFAIEQIKKLFKRWSFDLIYALPRQTLNEWLEELKKALTLSPTHLSLYTLIIDDNTPLGRMVKLGNIVPKTDDEIAEFYDATNDFLQNNSQLEQYEVSNYAIKGQESRHNLMYWNSDDYIGIGAGAHGRLKYKNGKRYELQNIFNYIDWQNSICCNNNGLEIERELTKKEQVEEILIMGLRTKYGIDFEDIKNRFNIDLIKFLNEKKLKEFQQDNLLTFNNKKLVLKPNGLKLLDFVVRNILVL